MLRKLTESQLSGFRLKQVLILMVGYTMSEIDHMYKTDSNNGVIIQQTTFVQQIVKQILLEISKDPFMTKKCLIEIFSIVLNIYKQNLDIVNMKTPQELFKIFQVLTIEGLRLSCIDQSEIAKTLTKILHQIVQKDDNNSNKTISKIQQKSLQIKIYNLQHQKSQTQKICEICLIPLSNQSYPQKKPIKLSKCEHEFHQNCIFETIKQYLNSQDNILFDSIKQQSTQLYQKFSQKQIITKIKCPNFQSCSVYFTLQQIHNFILSLLDQNKGQLSKNQKYSQLLEKVYEKTFNHYIVNENFTSFQELGLRLQNQKYFLKEKSSYLFYCKTSGCNAIYQINENETGKIIKDGTIFNYKPDKFICLSCKQPFCLQCFSPLHPTMTCKQHLISASTLPQDQELQKFIKTLKKPYKKCPKCRFYVQNWRGCSTVKCRCGTQFCFKCGNIGCPHAKCLKEIEKQQKQKQKQKFGKQEDKDKQKKINRQKN